MPFYFSGVVTPIIVTDLISGAAYGQPDSVSVRMSWSRLQVSLGPSFTGLGYLPFLTPSSHVDLEMGISSRTS